MTVAAVDRVLEPLSGVKAMAQSCEAKRPTPDDDYRELVIVELADDNAGLRQDVRSYRALAREAMYALREHRIQYERLRESHHRLLTDYRRLRIAIAAGDEGRNACRRTS